MKIALALFLLSAAAVARPIVANVDASQAPRRLFQVQLSIPVQPGPINLLYAKWIPGEHAPTGPLDGVVDLHILAGAQELDWQRDPYEMYRLKLVVPQATDHLDVKFSFVNGFASENLGVISWNELLLYPEGQSSDDIRVQGSVKLPPGWQGVGALQTTPSFDQIALPESDLTTMVDSPLLMGRFFTHVPFKPRAFPNVPALPHALHVAGERQAAVKMPADYNETLERLVEEAGLVFQSRHYAHYDWLISLTEVPRSFGGLEHHQSSDNVMEEDTLLEESTRQDLAELLAHEFVHSWCGKFRRPAGLLSADYMKPMDGSLLWVYEGMTTFWGEILPVRAGVMKPERWRDSLAYVAASYQYEAGKRWRPLADTATAAQRLYEAPAAWKALRRSTDFYAESILLWLEVDARLRQLSNEEVCLDDFCARFFGGPSGTPGLKPYEEEEVYTTLNSLVPHDWRKLIRSRLEAKDGKYFSSALEQSGWRLIYTDKKNEALSAIDAHSKDGYSRMFSLGFSVGSGGKVRDVDEAGPAAAAGLAPGMTLVAVNGRKLSKKILDEAIAARQSPVKLLIENGDYYREISLNYSGGPHYPHLERIPNTPDRLSQVLKGRGAEK
jgi:predicted metalloprotease with PDZ domain